MPGDKDEPIINAKGPAKPEVNSLGLTVKDLTAQQKKRLGKNGLVVVEAQGNAAQAGIRRGDVILALNNSEIQSAEQFNKQIAAMGSAKTVALLVQRGENTLYVPIKTGGK
jgi:serine protease Do